MCGIFFFKQKTAYEMRISDWSSDVCSSDLGLREERRFGLVINARLTQTVSPGGREDHMRVALEERDGTIWAAPLPSGSAIITSMVRDIGRASCRERVC